MEGDGEFDNSCLQDIDNDVNSGVQYEEDRTTPNPEDYGDMHTDERPEDDDAHEDAAIRGKRAKTTALEA
mgnify:FL=1